MARRDQHDEEPEVYAVRIDSDDVRFSRRNFLELASAGAAVAVVAGCASNKPKHPSSSPPSTTVPARTSASPTPTSATPTTPTTRSKTPTPTKPPGKKGKVQPGHKGTQYRLRGQSYVLPCGSPIPKGAVCTCNCVTVPPRCSCVGHTECSCVGYNPCSCVGNTGCSAVSHYWYPN